MHVACNNTGRYALAADKLPFHTLMTAASLLTWELAAITENGRQQRTAQHHRRRGGGT
jgi:hypothetical protein